MASHPESFPGLLEEYPHRGLSEATPYFHRRWGEQFLHHTFRHACAVRLLQAGVELNLIRNWLGHVSLETASAMPKLISRKSAARLTW